VIVERTCCAREGSLPQGILSPGKRDSAVLAYQSMQHQRFVHSTGLLGSRVGKSVGFLAALCWTLTGKLAPAPAWAIEFSAYSPDITGESDVSPSLKQALQDAYKGDGVLRVSPGKYLLAKGVAISPHVTISCGQGTAVFRGVDKQTDLFLFGKNQGNRFEGLNFQHCRKAFSCVGDGYIATARFARCGFSDCEIGVDGTPIQVVTFEECAFSKCAYGIREGRGYGGRSNMVVVTRSSFTFCSEWGVEVEGSPANIRDCNFESCEGGGIAFVDAMVGTVEGCYFEAVGKERNLDVLISAARLRTGIVSIRNNQFNSGFAQNRVVVDKNNGAHVYDNFVYVRADQTFVKDDSTTARVRVHDNFLEGEGKEK